MNRTPDEQLIYNALSQVHTPRCDIEKGVRLRLAADSGRQRRALPRRTLLMAATLALFLIIGAVAAGVSGLWQHFWPGAHIPSTAVTSPGVSQTAGDYTLTLEDVMADDSGIILLLSLSRSDGGPIDPDARLSGHVMHAGLLADGQSFGGGGMDTPVLSEDGTALFFCCELEDHRLSAGETLSGKQLTFTADGVVIPLYSDNALGYQPEQAVSLAALGALDIPEYSAEEDAAALEQVSIPLPLDEKFPQYRILGAAVTENGLGILLSDGTAQSGDLVCNGVLPEALVDTRTGETYSLFGGDGVTLSDSTRGVFYTFRDCPLTAADLPWLELIVSYQMDKVLSDVPFSLTFTADQSAALTLDIQTTVDLNGTALQFTGLRLSALDVSFTAANGIGDLSTLSDRNIAPVLTMADGSQIATVWQGGSGSSGGPSSAHFQPVDNDGNRIFPDTADIVAVSLAGQTVWTEP